MGRNSLLYNVLRKFACSRHTLCFFSLLVFWSETGAIERGPPFPVFRHATKTADHIPPWTFFAKLLDSEETGR